MLLLGFWYLVGLITSLQNSFLGSFSSKTAYRNSKLGMRRDHSTEESQCKLVHMNVLFRHGSRYPSKDDMKEIELVHEKIIKSKTRQGIPEGLLNWKSPFSLNKAKKLSSVGYEEMKNLGERFRDRLMNVDGYLDHKRHVVSFSTSVQRSKSSGTMFLKQFLSENKSFEEITSMIKEKDDELRFFDNCPYYTKSVLKNKSSNPEYKKFLSGQLIAKVIKDIQTKWKLTDINLTADDVRLLYVMCGYEIANNISDNMIRYRCKLGPNKDSFDCPGPKSAPVQISPLCDILEPEHYNIIEYLYDLKHYWIKSYGRKINWHIGCDLMLPMIQYITKAAKGHKAALKSAGTSSKLRNLFLNEQSYLRGVFWFAHAETILPLVPLLGIFNQTSPMLAKSYPKRRSLINNPRRIFDTFRVSNIAPFSGNLALELHHCPHLVKGDNDGYVVRVRSNEKTLPWSLDETKEEVSLDAFLQHLEVCSADNYNRTNLCYPS